eukprot:163807_1
MTKYSKNTCGCARQCKTKQTLLIIIIVSIFQLFVTFHSSTTIMDLKQIIETTSSVTVSVNKQYQNDTLNLYAYGQNINVILTFVNIDYFDAFEKWFIIFSKTINATNGFENNLLLLTVCFDDAVFDKISEINNHNSINTLTHTIKVINIKHIKQCYQRNTPKINISLIWKYRLCVLKHLLELNDKQTLKSLILTDIDAYWLQNPYEYLNRYAFIDIMARRGRWPWRCRLQPNIDRPSGLVMGFIFFNNTMINKQILSESYNQCKQKQRCDDQQIVNCLLANTTNKYSLRFIENNNNELVDNRHNINKFNIVNIHYLPKKYFCRKNCMKILDNKTNELYIVHPLMHGQNLTQKLKFVHNHIFQSLYKS